MMTESESKWRQEDDNDWYKDSEEIYQYFNERTREWPAPPENIPSEAQRIATEGGNKEEKGPRPTPWGLKGGEMGHTKNPISTKMVTRDVYPTDDDEIDDEIHADRFIFTDDLPNDSSDETCRESKECEACSGCGNTTAMQMAREIMRFTLEEDVDLQLGYISNLAMLLHDRYNITDYEQRNQAAADILKLMCNVDIDWRKPLKQAKPIE